MDFSVKNPYNEGYLTVSQAKNMIKSKLTDQNLSEKVIELEKLVEIISRSKMMWEATFDVISDPVMIINKKFEITRANKALAKACGMGIKDVIQKKCYEVFAGYSSPCPKCPVGKMPSSEQSHAVELDVFPKSKRQYGVNAYSMPTIKNQADQIVLHYRDVTDEKQLQTKLRHSEKMAAVGTLAGGVAHEINNPLAGILAFVQLVMRELDTAHPVQGDLKEIEDAALRCKKIVRDLLDFSRLNLEEQMGVVSLNELISKSMSIIKINTKTSDIRLKQEYAEDLPAIKGDFNKLQQVLLNLISNSVHAMKHGGELTVSTFADADGKKVFMQVKDTGTGIPPEDLERIFDPYFTTKGQGEGTGLGLSICYKILEEHKAKIEIDSKVKAGTTVTLQFKALRDK